MLTKEGGKQRMKSTNNTFNKGMIADVSELTLDAQSYRYARNIDFISRNTKDDFILQKRSSYVLSKDTDDAEINLPYRVLAVKVLNDIAYIVSLNDDGDGEIGTYPSPVYEDVTNADVVVPLQNKYAPLNNFYDGSGDILDDANYNSPFKTRNFSFTVTSELDIELQNTYDGSINVILAYDEEPIRSINTRFAKLGDADEVTLIKRTGVKSSNTYSDKYFYQSELIPRVVELPELEFLGVSSGGKLLGGGYRYYFKYVNSDGGETDVIEESRVVSVFNGDTARAAVGVAGNVETSNTVRFKLTYLDRSYVGVRVYFTHYSGDTAVVGASYRIDKTFNTDSNGECIVMHTGHELTAEVDDSDINVSYTPISRSRTITTINNRLLAGNGKYEIPNSEYLRNVSKSLKISESTFDIDNNKRVSDSLNIENNYANPEFVYNRMGYWPGETYEIGIRYITDSGLTSVYPLQGIDNIDSDAVYDNSILGDDYEGFKSNGQNADGVYRFKADWENSLALSYLTRGSCLSIDARALESTTGIKGFFFVRRRRRKDKIYQGMLYPMATVTTQTQYKSGMEVCSTGMVVGVGLHPEMQPKTIDGVAFDSFVGGDVKYVPAPYSCMPFGSETLAGEEGPGSSDFVIQAPITSISSFKNFALYSGDVETAPARSASTFSGNSYGIEITDRAVKGSFGYAYTAAPAFNERIPYYSVVAGYENSSYGVANTSGQCSYIGTGQNVTSSGAMASLSDRNITIWWKGTGIANIAKAGLSGSDDALINTVDREFSGESYNYRISQNDDGIWSRDKPSSMVKYGQYIGIALEDMSSGRAEDLTMPIVTSTDEDQNRSAYLSIENIERFNYITPADEKEPLYLSYLTNVFSGTDGNHLSGTAWIDAYDINDDSSEYIQISKRYDVERFGDLSSSAQTLKIYGGDAFAATSWKQAWQPMGIPDVPNANDLLAYRDDARKALGLLKYGFAVGSTSFLNHNPFLRIPEEVESENIIYGSKRSFLPMRGYTTIRGNRQEETSLYNFGYSAMDETANPSFRLNGSAQYYKYSYPNRIYASDTDLTDQFVNGYSIFKGLSFKDYNPELGEITAIRKLGDVAIVIFTDGIAAVNVDEKQMVSEEGGVYIEGANALSRSKVIGKQTGATSKTGIVETEGFVYGYSEDQDVIWRTNGTAYEDISTHKVQTLLQTFKEKVDSVTNATAEVKASYDKITGDIYFTMYVLLNNVVDHTLSLSLVYNEKLGIWICETNDIRDFVFNIENIKHLILKGESPLYEYTSIGEGEPEENIIYNSFPGVFVGHSDRDGYTGKFNAELQFIVNGDGAQTNKHYNNFIISGSQNSPNTVEYESDTITCEQSVTTYTNKTFILNSDVVAIDTVLVLSTPVPTRIDTNSPITVGDPVTIIPHSGGVTNYTTVTASYDTPSGSEVHIGRPGGLNVFYNAKLYYGFKSPVRLSNASIEGTFCRLQIKGDYNKYAGSSKPFTKGRIMGKFLIAKFIYDGCDKLNINSVATHYTEYSY